VSLTVSANFAKLGPIGASVAEKRFGSSGKRQRVERAEALCDRLKQAILELVPQWSLSPVVQAIQALRGVSLIVAAAIVAEVGCLSAPRPP
jgi:hypothetical protein